MVLREWICPLLSIWLVEIAKQRIVSVFSQVSETFQLNTEKTTDIIQEDTPKIMSTGHCSSGHYILIISDFDKDRILRM